MVDCICLGDFTKTLATFCLFSLIYPFFTSGCLVCLYEALERDLVD